MSIASRKHGILNYWKQKNEQEKRTSREYYVQKHEDVEHHDVKIYFTKNKFPELQFCGPHNRPHGVRGLSKHHHMIFDTKLGHQTCAIRCIN